MRKLSELSPAERYQIDNDFAAVVEIVQNGKPQQEFKAARKLWWWAIAVVAVSLGLLIKTAGEGQFFSVSFIGALGLCGLSFYTLIEARKRIKLLMEEMGLRFPHYRGSRQDAELHNHLIAQLELKYETDLERMFIRDIGGTPVGLPTRFTVPEGFVVIPYIYSFEPNLVLGVLAPRK